MLYWLIRVTGMCGSAWHVSVYEDVWGVWLNAGYTRHWKQHYLSPDSADY